MQKTRIKIPNYKDLELLHIVLDYNGTIAKDGILLKSVQDILADLTQHYRVHVITADTFGSVKEQLTSYDVSIKILSSSNHTLEKAEYIKELLAKNCVAFGNGNNDAEMLSTAEIGGAILGDEGCATQTLLKSDITCKSIKEALELFLYTKRLVATLRT